MNSFEPLINLIVLLTTLSIISERVTNIFKLRRSNLRIPASEEAKRAREYTISFFALCIGVLVAVLVKADFFAILKHLDSPWTTLGWLQVEKYNWTRTPATASIGNLIHCLAGCVITGCALGFGSKFWHDTLGSIYEIRTLARNRNLKNIAVVNNESKGGSHS